MFHYYVKKVNKNIEIIPIFHDKKQHGLEDTIMNKLKGFKPSLLVVPDAGTNDIDKIKKLQKGGWKIILCDHHLKSDNIKAFEFLVNNQTSQKVKNKSLSGTGTTWKLLSHFDKKYGYNYANDLISYVAISIISDSMSLLTYENRLFIKYGLRKIHPNIQPLIDEFIKGPLTPTVLSFNLINRMNAVIRSDNQEEKERLFYLLCGENKDYKQVIKDCKVCHNFQKQFVKSMVEDILPTIDDKEKIIIAHTDVSSAYTGLVANQLMSKFNKSVLLVHKKNDCYEGSGRSPIGLKEVLKDSGLMTICAGHSQALGVGWQINNTKKLKEYINNLDIDIEPTIKVLQSYNSNNIPNKLFGLFDNYNELYGMDINIPRFHVYNIKINSSQIKEIRYNAMISFYVNGIEFIKKFVSRDIKQSIWHMDKPTDLEIECICELTKSDYDGHNVAIIDKFEIKVKDENWEELFDE